MASEATIITSLCWVSRGYASQNIEEYEPNPEDLKAYKQITKQLDKKYERKCF